MRRKSWARPELDKCDFFIKSPENHKGCWAKRFKNELNPIYLELGCGKGGFIAQQAILNPDINFLAVDIKSEVLAVGRRKIVSLFEENNREVDNILLMSQDIERIDNILDKEDKVRQIYINFCNPWPKKKHMKRRLTYPKQLLLYKRFLVPEGKIRFKTDHEGLFDDSLEYFEIAGYKIVFRTRDLHNSQVDDNVETEHEKMFKEEGKKIFYLEAVLEN